MNMASKKRMVLIVDDARCIREVIGYALGEKGFTIESAANGIEALPRL